jgi:hypothetical protein
MDNTGEITHALLRLEAPAQRQRGWMPKLFAVSNSRGSFFSRQVSVCLAFGKVDGLQNRRHQLGNTALQTKTSAF